MKECSAPSHLKVNFVKQFFPPFLCVFTFLWESIKLFTKKTCSDSSSALYIFPPFRSISSHLGPIRLSFTSVFLFHGTLIFDLPRPPSPLSPLYPTIPSPNFRQGKKEEGRQRRGPNITTTVLYPDYPTNPDAALPPIHPLVPFLAFLPCSAVQ